MKRHNFILFSLLMITSQCLAQHDFKYKRSIAGVADEGWYALRLPSDIFRHLNEDVSDIRLYSVTGRDTLELPYLLDIRDDEVVRETVSLPLLNKSTRNGELYLMFELDRSQRVNHLDLTFDNDNYFAFVTVEGSDSRNEWFEIAKDLRLVSIRHSGGNYALSTINFALTDYRFLRIRVRSEKPLRFQKASFGYHNLVPGVQREIPLSFNKVSDKKLKQSFVNIKMSAYVPISSIRVSADSARDYYRPFRIEYVRDSVRTEKAWIRYYGTLYEGNLTSYTSNTFAFERTMAREVRLVIQDRDNAPLDIYKVSARGPEVRVISRLGASDNFMLYGSERMRPPSYDLTHFGNKIPGDFGEATLGDEEKLYREDDKVRPLFQRKFWLWGIMTLMIGLLGFFTLRMMNQKG